jgi:RNA-directed DNA polymerase
MTQQPVWYKVRQLNQILRGWSAYYQHVNAKTTFSKLDWWVLTRMFLWARKKHGKPAWREVNAKYKHRDPKGRINFVCRLRNGNSLWLYRMSDRPIRRYWVDWQRPTYTAGGITTDIEDTRDSLEEPKPYPAKESDQMRYLARRRDNYTCQQCGETATSLHVHHIVPKTQGGTDDLDNLITLCPRCHHAVHKSQAVGRMTELTVNADGEP